MFTKTLCSVAFLTCLAVCGCVSDGEDPSPGESPAVDDVSSTTQADEVDLYARGIKAGVSFQNDYFQRAHFHGFLRHVGQDYSRAGLFLEGAQNAHGGGTIDRTSAHYCYTKDCKLDIDWHTPLSCARAVAWTGNIPSAPGDPCKVPGVSCSRWVCS
jgi:hypothetical protein